MILKRAAEPAVYAETVEMKVVVSGESLARAVVYRARAPPPDCHRGLVDAQSKCSF